MEDVESLQRFGRQLPFRVGIVLCKRCEAVCSYSHKTDMVHGFEVCYRWLCEQLIRFEPQVAERASQASLNAAFKQLTGRQIERALHAELEQHAAQVAVMC